MSELKETKKMSKMSRSKTSKISKQLTLLDMKSVSNQRHLSDATLNDNELTNQRPPIDRIQIDRDIKLTRKLSPTKSEIAKVLNRVRAKKSKNPKSKKPSPQKNTILCESEKFDPTPELVDNQVKTLLVESQIPVLSPKIGSLDNEVHPAQISTEKSDLKKSDFERPDLVGLNEKSDLKSLNNETIKKLGTVQKRKQTSILDFGRPIIDLKTQDQMNLASDLTKVLGKSPDCTVNINVDGISGENIESNSHNLPISEPKSPPKPVVLLERFSDIKPVVRLPNPSLDTTNIEKGKNIARKRKMFRKKKEERSTPETSNPITRYFRKDETGLQTDKLIGKRKFENEVPTEISKKPRVGKSDY